MTDAPKGPYTVWTDYGSEGWKWADYATLEDAVMAPKHMATTVIQKPVKLYIAETPEPPKGPVYRGVEEVR